MTQSTVGEPTKLWHILLNNTAACLLAYLLVFFLGQFFTAFFATYYLQDATIYFYGTEIEPLTSYWIWNAIVVTYLGYPLAAILVATVAKLLHFSHFRHQPGYGKVLALWAYLWGCNFFFTAFITGTITQRGFGHALFYSRFPFPFTVTLAVIFFIFMIIIMVRSYRYFLSNAPQSYFTEIYDGSRFQYTLNAVVYPTLLVCLGLTGLRFITSPKPFDKFLSPEEYNMAGFVMYVFIMVLVYRTSWRYIKHENEHQGLEGKLILAALVFFALCLIILIPGWEFKSAQR